MITGLDVIEQQMLAALEMPHEALRSEVGVSGHQRREHPTMLLDH
jgi:hypothetical protein